MLFPGLWASWRSGFIRYGGQRIFPGGKGDGNVKRVDASRLASLTLCAVNNQGGSNRSRMR